MSACRSSGKPCFVTETEHIKFLLLFRECAGEARSKASEFIDVDRENSGKLNYAQFCLLIQEASLLYAGKRKLPVQWNDLPAGIQAELVNVVDTEALERIAVCLLPHLKQKSISNLALESIDTRVHRIIIKSKEGNCYSYSIRRAILILYSAFVQLDGEISPFLEEKLVACFIEIAKVILSERVAELGKKNEQLTLVIRELERNLRLPPPSTPSKEGPQRVAARNELEELKRLISVKELSVKFHNARISSNDSMVSSVRSHDFHNPFYEPDASSVSQQSPKSYCSAVQTNSSCCNDSESVSPSLATSNTPTNFPGIKIPPHRGPIAYVRAVYAYEKQQDDEISFPEGAAIAVYHKGDDDWWNGEVVSSRAVGWFPSNYAREMHRCTVTQSYSNQIIQGRTVYATEHDNEWVFVYVPECEWSGIVPANVLDFPKGSQESNTKQSASEDPTIRNEQQHAVLLELISTENRYVQNLSLMVQFYYKPLKAQWPENEISLLFCNTCDLLENSIPFCNDLGLCENGMMVAKLFMEHSFDAYIRYCTNQADASDYLIRRLKIDKEFGQFIQEQKKYPDLKGKDLGTFLLEPMQRITRYPLLLRQLLKYSENSLEKQKLGEALERIETLLAKINGIIQQREREAKLQDLNNRLAVDGSDAKYSFDLTKPTKSMGMRILFGDFVPKKVKGIGKNCKIYLFNDMLLFTSVPKSANSSVSLVREPIPTQHISIKTGIAHRSPFVIDIANESQPDSPEIVSVYLENRSDRTALLHSLNETIEAVRVAQIAQMSRNSPSNRQHRLTLRNVTRPPFPITASLGGGPQRESKPFSGDFSTTQRALLSPRGELQVQLYRYEPWTESQLLWESHFKPNCTNQQIQFPITPNFKFKAVLDLQEVS